MKIAMPELFSYKTEIAVRITDLNYGNHLANQNILTYAHEARVQFYAEFGLTEMDFGGVGLIQSDAAILFKGEAFYGDVLSVHMKAEISGSSAFQVYYRFENQDNKLIAEARTAMVCFDYEKRRPVKIPGSVLESGFFN